MDACFTAMPNAASCCSSRAAACTSAPVSRILDTALQAVSIFVVIDGAVLPVPRW